MPLVTSAAPTPSLEAMWELIQAQQKTIAALEARIAATEDSAQAAGAQLATVDAKVEAATTAVEQVAASAVRSTPDRDRAHVGGYGELHYNHLDNDGTAGDLDQVDFHRFVLYVGYEFTDSIRFFSELEVEHSLAGEGKRGEVELEQAWIELGLSESHQLRTGLDVLPVGIINVTHEPDTFYGVERNKVESEIIPSTWWEAVAGLNGELAPGWNYDVVAHSGLVVPTTGGSAFRPRDGRLKVSEAKDQDIAATGRIRYTGMPGLELALSAQYQADITGTADTADIDATLVSAHLDWRHHSGFGLRALYARWDMGSDGAVDPALVGADNLQGWYIEPAYRFRAPLGRFGGDLGVFARYSAWDARNELSPLSYLAYDQTALGFNFWPHAQVVFKFDVQWETADGTVRNEFDGIHLGMGYSF
jgi:hypothetical protein